MIHSKEIDEYGTYSEVFDGKYDRFCYVINEVTTDSSVSSSSLTLESVESDTGTSDEEERTDINRGYHGFRPPGIPSCIEEQNEEGHSLPGTIEELGFQNGEHNRPVPNRSGKK